MNFISYFFSFLSEEKKSRLLPLLSDEEKLSLKEKTEEISFSDFSYVYLLEMTHYSWFFPILKHLSILPPSYTSKIFSESAQKKIASQMSFSKETCEISNIGKKFISSLILKKLLHQSFSLLPKTLLKDSEKASFLDLSKKELTQLIELLSMHDLALALKKTVSKEIMQKVNECISPLQKKYLKQIYYGEENIAFPPLELVKIINDKHSLLTQLHRRGIQRLAMALSDECYDFIWHIAHILDIGRGTLLLNFAKEKPPTEALTILSKELEKAILFIQNKGNPS
ncbi:MAG TPA: hypothetical protein P5048_02065 [Chlamydiales bacterium]|nr:hypothetical protein [Chlamydiales bacterium]